MSHQEERLEIMKQFIKSSGWKYICEEIDASIEANRVELDTINTNMKEVKYDGYDLARMRIAYLRELKNLPSIMTFNEDETLVEYEDEL